MSQKPKTIKDILATLSPEEMEFHKELIEECLQTEADLDGYSKNLKGNFEKINQITNKIVDDFNKIVNTTFEINFILSKPGKGVH